jgi:glyoxylase-like metal-dependent hydrolase (beta-lactamase superfamily II)
MKSRARLSQLLVFCFAVSAALTAGTADKSYREARDVLDAGIKAMGGVDALKAIKSIRRTGTATAFAQGQSRLPEGPLDTRQLEATGHLDFAAGRSRTEITTTGSGVLTTKTRAVLNGEQSFGYNVVTNTITPTSPAAVTGARAAMRRDHAILLLTALARAETLRSLGDRVITFSDADGTQMALHFDATTGLLAKTETLADNAVLGDALTETLFSDYRDVAVGAAKVRLPARVVTRVAGEVTQETKYATIEANAALTEDMLAAPKDAINVPPAPMAAGGMPVTKLGDDAYYLLGGTHFSIAVGFKDHVVVVEAPLGEDRSLAVLAKVAELFPGKPVRYVVPTHFHFDHSGGLRTYVSKGITILTTPGNKAMIERMSAAPHTIRPDSLSREAKKPVIETFTKKKVLSDGARTLELHDVGPNPHVTEMVVAYLPKEKALFVADLITIPLSGPWPPPSPALVDFADRMAKLGLDVETIAPAHGRLGTMEDLKAALAAK